MRRYRMCSRPRRISMGPADRRALRQTSVRSSASRDRELEADAARIGALEQARVLRRVTIQPREAHLLVRAVAEADAGRHRIEIRTGHTDLIARLHVDDR